jgi:CDGSH-type Zn-finger protein
MQTDNNKKPVEFRVMPNGPLHVKGNFTLLNSNGETVEINDEAFLCRCGASKNKPFCDGSHRTSGAIL